MEELELEFNNMTLTIKIKKSDMNPIKLKDLKRGFYEEGRMKAVLEKYHNTTLEKTADNFVFDYKTDTAYYEIKSRNCAFARYPTTMVGKNKFDFANELPDKEFYFVFCFTDGDFIYHYNRQHRLYFDIGGRNDRGKDEYKEYCYIPTWHLSRIDQI
jgi:hypothetical protein